MSSKDHGGHGQLLKKTYQGNFVGESCIAIAIKHHFLSKESIKHIAGIAYANMCQIDEIK